MAGFYVSVNRESVSQGCQLDVFNPFLRSNSLDARFDLPLCRDHCHFRVRIA